MNKQGQIFLLLTILAVTFLLTISTVLLNIQVSEYSQPSADSGKLYEAWDNTVTSAVQIMSVQISYNTNNGATNSSTLTLSPHFDDLVLYLNSKGLVASIEEVSEQYTISPLGQTYSQAMLNTSLDIYIATSSGAKLQGNVTLSVSYNAVIAGSNNLLIVYKLVNNNSYFLNNVGVASLNGNSIQNTGNGSYQLLAPITTPDTLTITTSDFVILQVQLP